MNDARDGNGPDPASSGPPQGPASNRASTGSKLFIGCAIAAVVGLVIVAGVVMVGGFFLKRGLESVVGEMDDQQEATAILRQLETDHPFRPPEDGLVTREQAEKFFAVTDEAWPKLESWAEDIARLNRDSEAGDRKSLGDLAAGARGLGGIVNSRVILAEALEEHKVSLGEYVWTGLTLTRDTTGRFRQQIQELETDDPDRPGKGVVLQLATIWGISEGSTFQGLGLDTLSRGPVRP